MTDVPSYLERPRKSPTSDDYWEYLNLAGEIGRFDVSQAKKFWVGLRFEDDNDQDGKPKDEFLYRTSGDRFVLIFLVYSEPGDPPMPWTARELTREDAALWLMINRYELPPGLDPTPLRDPSKHLSSRVNFEWRPESPNLDSCSLASGLPDSRPASPREFTHGSEILYDELINDLLQNRQTHASRLVARMRKHRSLTVSFEDIEASVYEGEQRTSQAIRSLVNRTNNEMVIRKVPLRFKTADGRVIKESPPG